MEHSSINIYDNLSHCISGVLGGLATHMVMNHQDGYLYLNLHFFVENILKPQFLLVKLIGQGITDGKGRGIARDI